MIEMMEKRSREETAELIHKIDCTDEQLRRKLMEYQETLTQKKNQISKVSFDC